MVDPVLRAGLVADEFVDVACRENPTPAEAARAQLLKEEMAKRLLCLPADKVYDANLRLRDSRSRIPVARAVTHPGCGPARTGDAPSFTMSEPAFEER